ncbi:hypothetical protein [Aeropyrum camini]|uniref:Uncharacterized protein n=1 Tax=Aeropyrum camini SY1 = JCM 12091 TaxID=1198449 RepID=U3TG11_9CREN|nr:hypothetical protein [Aeropyrum camini]BAN90933.1 hypothetical protein ACAM_1464 [Aeropyrum camini SY1 = JCM 12091]
MEGIDEAKKVLQETITLAKKLYGRRWMDAIERLEEMYDGDPYWVLEHLRREARRRGVG